MMSMCYLLHLGFELLIVNLLSMCCAALCRAGLSLWPATVLLLLVVLQGKQQAEQELFRSYPETGVALRPWIIYGDRALRSVTVGWPSFSEVVTGYNPGIRIQQLGNPDRACLIGVVIVCVIVRAKLL